MDYTAPSPRPNATVCFHARCRDDKTISDPDARHRVAGQCTKHSGGGTSEPPPSCEPPPSRWRAATVTDRTTSKVRRTSWRGAPTATGPSPVTLSAETMNARECAAVCIVCVRNSRDARWLLWFDTSSCSEDSMATSQVQGLRWPAASVVHPAVARHWAATGQ